jgi:SAM-dependent methyltransferase
MLHGVNLKERYVIVSKEIGYGKLVFELGCGTGILTDYLDKSCDYIGWDLNQRFIKYVRRRGYKAEVRDIFNFADYPDSDICVLIDVLHHIIPKQEVLIKNILDATKKLIVVEPYKAFNVPLPDSFRKRYDSVFGDNDGINSYRNRSGWHYSPERLNDYFLSLGASKVTEMNKDIVAVFLSSKCNVSKVDNS